jgi:4-hydroxybenzoate polyprenyl transferase
MKNKLSAYFRLSRLDKPIGIWLLLLPSLWAIILTHKFDVKIILIFIFGSIIMRSAGCVINDVWDRKIDAQITRTKNRPLASGEISLFGALSFFTILCISGLLLLLQLNQNTLLLGIVFLGFVIVYPLMKRVLSIPQIFLAITFNAGVLMATMAIENKLTFTSWLLFIACFFWTLAYDTIYAHQDKTDDLKIGIKSSAIAFGKHSKKYITLYYLLMFALLFSIGWFHQISFWFYITLLLSLVLLIKKIFSLNLQNTNECLYSFKFNAPLGLMILIAFSFSYF